MREIKFRAFDEDTNKFTYYENWSEIYSMAHDAEYNKNLIINQFTGLLDKNGKEIYEGDILVKNETDYEEWQKEDYEGEIPIKKVLKDVATMERFPCYWLKNESFGYEGEDLENPTDWEVIGNIYENPELLNN